MQTVARPVQLNKLQPELIRLVRTLQDDLRQRCDEIAEVGEPVKEQYEHARAAGRTADTFHAWREPYLNQVAVAWVLTSLFLRYLEDNRLIAECYLAGEGPRAAQAREHYSAYFQKNPEHSDRDYFLHLFKIIADLPGCAELFGPERNPLYKIGISGDGARTLRLYWQEVDPATGELLRPLGGDTRFLGDLYQNLSEEAQKKYALLQTPDFIEEFILSRTLAKAIEAFPLEEVRVIDPTCGSGHFLLGSFKMLLDAWQLEKPTDNIRDLARKALESVYGVDINPFAVAIARFRLVIAYLNACSLTSLNQMPDVHPNVATGDSLLHGNTIFSSKGWGQHSLTDWLPDAFAEGDYQDATAYLSQKYHAVVGNPPYIVDRDKSHNNAVRANYRTAYQKFSLAVPFKEKFWDLTVEGRANQRAGYIGMITANSFMKREFGSRVIEEFFPQVDLTHVLDTSGAYIPGHGTPTVILFGRNQAPGSTPVRAVLGIRGEPSTPADPAQGLVWRSIVDLIDTSHGDQNAYVSVADVPRETFAKHPWSIGGGGASELKEKLVRRSSLKIGELAKEIGWTTVVGEDDIWIFPDTTGPERLGLTSNSIRLVVGDRVRDWDASALPMVLYPYVELGGKPIAADSYIVTNYLWPYKILLKNRTMFHSTLEERGLPYYEHMQHSVAKLRTPLSITFAEVATHNHFVLDRGGKVFNRTAPVIKLPPDASEDQHLALLGILNSSTANFWAKQVFYPKGGDYVGTEGARVVKNPWEDRLQRDGSKLQDFPIPPNHSQVLDLTRELQNYAELYARHEPSALLVGADPHLDSLRSSQFQQPEMRKIQIALQEELDWLCYQLYGIIEQAPLADPKHLQPIELGQRAFEIALARSGEDTTWFSRHNSTPITDLPSNWRDAYRQVVEQRLQLIASNPEIALLEKPEHKRRWQQEPWDVRVQAALKTWLQNHLEDTLKHETELASTATLADRLAGDDTFRHALQLYLKADDYDLTKAITDLATPQAVPYLAALRYSEAGLRIRADWEHTWQLQRRQDAGETNLQIPVPPKYGQKDFLKTEYWQLRGKLDVPKERFIAYPGAERESDSTPVLAWAGLNHLQRAQALAAYYIERKDNDGWTPERLTPLLAGLAELLPWLKQWHNQLDPEMDLHLGDYYEAFLEEQLRELNLTPTDLSNWRPPTKARAKRK